MLKYYTWQTRTRCGVCCAAERIDRSVVQEFLENFNGEFIQTLTNENDWNNGSEFHAVCSRKVERIERGLVMLLIEQEGKDPRITGQQVSKQTDFVLLSKVPQKSQKRSYDYERSYGKINPLAFVDYFGRKPKGKDY